MLGFDYSKYLGRGKLETSGPIWTYEFTERDFGVRVQWHLSIWLSNNDLTDFRILYDRRPESRHIPQMSILFGKQKDFRDFIIWWENYLLRFVASRSKFLPELPVGQSVTITSVPVDDGYDPNRMELEQSASFESIDSPIFQAWSWIAHYTRKRVWYMPGTLLFEDNGEAVLYKLSKE